MTLGCKGLKLTSWVVLLPLHNNIGWSSGVLGWSHELDVSLLGVVGVGYDTIPIAETLGQDVEVMSVKLATLEFDRASYEQKYLHA